MCRPAKDFETFSLREIAVTQIGILATPTVCPFWTTTSYHARDRYRRADLSLNNHHRGDSVANRNAPRGCVTLAYTRAYRLLLRGIDQESAKASRTISALHRAALFQWSRRLSAAPRSAQSSLCVWSDRRREIPH